MRQTICFDERTTEYRDQTLMSNFEWVKTIFCDIELDIYTIKDVISNNYKEYCSGFICILNQDTLKLEILSNAEMIQYVSDNCNAKGKMGTDTSSMLTMFCTKLDNNTLDFYVEPEDISECTNNRRIIFLNLDADNNVIESWLDNKNQVCSKYASIPLTEFYFNEK